MNFTKNYPKEKKKKDPSAPKFPKFITLDWIKTHPRLSTQTEYQLMLEN